MKMSVSEKVIQLLKYIGSANITQMREITDASKNTLNVILPKLVKDGSLVRRNGNRSEGEENIYYLEPKFLQSIGYHGHAKTWNFKKNSFCVDKIIDYKTILEEVFNKKMDFEFILNHYIYPNYSELRPKHSIYSDAEVVLDFIDSEGNNQLHIFMYLGENLNKEERRFREFWEIAKQLREENENMYLDLKYDSLYYMSKNYIEELKTELLNK
ncbi:hypothetical protein [Virgibacillus sp. DJP39]|uniref:hypothetical protein n=1 Tax=Virgibacillus sp. DJP39 TaxID=3409790 RepID=UPI003BB69873